MSKFPRLTGRWLAVLRCCSIGVTFSWTHAYAQIRLPIQVPSALSGAMNSKAPSQVTPTLNPKYGSKAEFLAAARRGEMIDYTNGSNANTAPILDSIENIVAKEYGTPIPYTRDTDCYRGTLRSELSEVLANVTETKARTRSNNPPDFISNKPSVSDVRDPMQGIRNVCHFGSYGHRMPVPAIDSLDHLLAEYAVATQAFVDAERTTRQQQYQEQLVRQQEEQRQQEAAEQEAQRQQDAALAKKRAEEKAAEQKRIDAERQRIEEEEKKAKEREAQQVSG